LITSGQKVERVLPHGGATLRAAALLPNFFDLTYAYRFGPPSHDVTVVTLVDVARQIVLDQAFHFPSGLGSFPPCELGLEGAMREIEGGKYAVSLHTRRFALSVSVAVEGCVPDDNYFHLAPGGEKTVTLVRRSGQGQPRGFVQALNGRTPVRLVLSDHRTGKGAP
jgi:beta-mannosidase